jgi:SH3 domain protein
VVAKKANLRSGANARYSVVATVDVGLVVSVIEEKDGWTHVSFDRDGLTYDGWISSEMLKK